MKKFVLAFAAIAAAVSAHAAQPKTAAVGAVTQHTSTSAVAATAPSAEPIESAKPVAVPPAPMSLKLDKADTTKVYVGLTAYHETYQEFADNGDKLMQEVGTLKGAFIGVTKELQNHAAVRAELTLARGDSKYTGAYWGGQYGDLVIDDLSRSMIGVYGEYSQTSPKWNGVTATAGLGYRHLTDHLDEAGPAGYRRVNGRIYAAFGLKRDFKLDDKWTLTPRAQYKHILYSEQYSNLQGGISVEQKGRGAEYAMDIAYRDGKCNLTLSPFVRTWNVKASNVVNRLYEPKNDTREVGVSLSVAF